VGTQVGPGRGVGLTTAPLAINSIDFNGRYFLLYTSASPPYAAQVLEATSGLPLIPDTPDADIYRSMPGGYKDIAMDELGNIFVCMQQTSEVWKFSRKGEFILKFGQGDDPGARLNKPRGIDVYQNRIYIADTDNNRIICFEASISWQP